MTAPDSCIEEGPRMQRRKGTSVPPGIEEKVLSVQAEQGSKSSLTRAPQNRAAWNP